MPFKDLFQDHACAPCKVCLSVGNNRNVEESDYSSWFHLTTGCDTTTPPYPVGLVCSECCVCFCVFCICACFVSSVVLRVFVIVV